MSPLSLLCLGVAFCLIFYYTLFFIKNGLRGLLKGNMTVPRRYSSWKETLKPWALSPNKWEKVEINGRQARLVGLTYVLVCGILWFYVFHTVFRYFLSL